MMRPPIGFCSFIMRNACWVHKNVPWTIEPMTPFQRSQARSSISEAAPKPALLNSTSSRPKAALVLANKFSTEAGSLVAARQTIVDLAEGGKRDRDLLGGHADAVIGDSDDGCAVCRRRADS